MNVEKLNEMVSKRFVVRQSLIGKNVVITVNFKTVKLLSIITTKCMNL